MTPLLPRTNRRRPGLLALLAATALTLAALVAALGHAAAAEGEAVSRPAKVSEAQFATVVTAVVEGAVRPLSERFAASTELLATETATFCSAPDDAGLASVRRAFEGTARSFLALQPVSFGPLREENRSERLAFWPDPRGLGLKQVQALLAAADPAVADPAALKGKSVGVQGLTALEFVLYGPPAETLLAKDAFACRYAVAVTAAVDAIAGEVVAAWADGGPSAKLFLEPGPTNPLFRTHAEVVAEIFGSVATALEDVSDRKIRVLIGIDEAHAKPKLSLFWRSGQTMPGIVAELEAMSQLVEVSGIAGLVDPAEVWLPNSIRFVLGKAADAARKVAVPVEAIPTDHDARSAATYVMVSTDELKGAVGGDLLKAVGLDRGFNALDGD